MRQELTEKRKTGIIYSLNYIWLLAECIKTEHIIYLKDTNFKNPLIHNFANRITEDAKSIQKFLKITVPDEDVAEERMLELHRTLKFFADKNTEELREFNDRVEQESICVNF